MLYTPTINFTRMVNKMAKSATHPIRNWGDYNKALKRRGSITFWFDDDSLEQWHACVPTGKRGRPYLYADIAIQCLLLIKSVFHLDFRKLEGFAASLVKLMNVAINIPSYTQMCRRQKSLAVDLSHVPCQGPIHVLVDSTGLKVFGEGEWKVRQHGYSKRRTWRKLHLGVDEAIDARNAQANIPPRRDAILQKHGNCKGPPLTRDENIRAIKKKGRKRWKQDVGYHRRSLAETAMFRFKTLFSDTLSNRLFDHQLTEAVIKCQAMNKMTQLGMPQYDLT